MRTPCDDLLDDLALVVDGDADAIARHADHLASCDACRDTRHDASELASRLALAGDYTPPPDLLARVTAALDADADAAKSEIRNPKPEIRNPPPEIQAPKPAARNPKSEARRPKSASASASASAHPLRAYVALGAAAAAAAVAALAISHVRASHEPTSTPGLTTAPSSLPIPDGAVATITRVDRAAAATDHADGLFIRAAATRAPSLTAAAWRPLHANDAVPAGASLRTDDRTRAIVALADGTRVTLDHLTTFSLDAAEPRHMQLAAGHVVADVAHLDARPASITTPTGVIDIVGTRFAVTATDTLTAVQVARGAVVLHAGAQHDDVRAGEEGIIDHGALTVSAVPSIAHDLEWAELATPAKDDVSAGLGSLRAYKPGETRDRDWNLALAKHDVQIRIVGPIARTEITETFRNDSATVLEGVYQFPMPADAQIDALALDNHDAPGGFIDGAFVDKQRGAKIFQGVIQKASAHPQQLASNEIIWVPGRWRDPALLEWQRGGRFELKVYPIPAHGERTIKLAYTQVVAPHGPWRHYVYPLPHSHDGSTVADKLAIDIEVRGAAPGLVRAANYDLVADPARRDVNALTLTASAFVPRGDLAIDYRAADGDAELRAWTYAGGAAVAPDEALAKTQKVGLDPKVLAEQRTVAADLRPTAVLALHPQLPRWRQDKPRDYMIVVDDSQSMFGERFARASQLAAAVVAQMDRRDRFSVMTCDSECTALGDLRAPSATAAHDLGTWLAAQTPAGASDVVASVHAATAALTASADRERWILYVGDGFATTGFRRVADIERALAQSSRGAHLSTIGIGADSDAAVLAAAARGGGGSYLAWVPGQQVGTAAIAALETTYGAALTDATIELPAGLADAAPSVVPTVRAGDEILIGARVAGDVNGEVVLRGTVGGQPFEQRYPLALAVSAAPGNGFVPRLWASLAIDQLEQRGTNDDRARIVALSQGYSVMSRETSLLVLESQAMFDAFGIDRHHSAATWTGEEQLDEVASVGDAPVANLASPDDDNADSAVGKIGGGGRAAATGMAATPASVVATEMPPPPPAKPKAADATKDTDKAEKKTPSQQHAPMHFAHAVAEHRPAIRDGLDDGDRGGGFAEPMVAMRRVWERVASVAGYDGVAPSIAKAVADYDAALTANPDSREKHRALVQALAYAGDTERARDVAARWLDRDPLDPQALGYEADLLGRDGQRDRALRTLAGLVDLDPDRVALHERMVRAYDSVGRLAQACGHRLAIASLAPTNAMTAGAAVRCLRSLGRDGDAELVLRRFTDDKLRAAVEKAATVSPLEARVEGDLVIRAHWDNGADLDVSIVSPEGTRLSWMGGRADLVTADVTNTEREQLAIKTLQRGNYLVEIGRGAPASSSPGAVRGTLDIAVLGVRRSLPFELVGDRLVVGRVSVALESHLEEIDNGEQWNQIGPQTLAPRR